MQACELLPRRPVAWEVQNAWRTALAATVAPLVHHLLQHL